MAIEMVLVSDDVLVAAAHVKGSASAEARVLARLRQERRKDRQVHAFQLGDYWLTGPLPDARTEFAMIEVAEELAAEGQDD